jgi:hypothetical protein
MARPVRVSLDLLHARFPDLGVSSVLRCFTDFIVVIPVSLMSNNSKRRYIASVTSRDVSSVKNVKF